jgi:hypothetical protein
VAHSSAKLLLETWSWTEGAVAFLLHPLNVRSDHLSWRTSDRSALSAAVHQPHSRCHLLTTGTAVWLIVAGGSHANSSRGRSCTRSRENHRANCESGPRAGKTARSGLKGCGHIVVFGIICLSQIFQSYLS